jgi:hypothetical protein
MLTLGSGSSSSSSRPESKTELARMRLETNFLGSSTLILQSSFHIRLVSMAASIQGANHPRLTLGSTSSSELPEQHKQSLSSTHFSLAFDILGN